MWTNSKPRYLTRSRTTPSSNRVVQAVQEAAEKGTSYGAPTELEIELAEIVTRLVPSVEQVRLVNSGTEATMTAVRLARAFTNRSLVVKFNGCYHGHGDSFLIQAGSGIATLALPNSPGVPEQLAAQTVSLPFNDIDAIKNAFEQFEGQIAAVICEPVTGNMGVVVPPRAYLAELLDMAEKDGALVVFDEVMTGFRLALGGAQELFSLTPPLTCMGKVLGGGLPIGAVGGRRDIMEMLAPVGPVYQAGTLSGNPLAVAAGLEALRQLESDPPYASLHQKAESLCQGLEDAAREKGIEVQIQRCGSMFTLFFSDRPVTNFEAAKQSDTNRFSRFHAGMLEHGVYLAPSQFEACFLSTAHDDAAISSTIEAARSVFDQLD